MKKTTVLILILSAVGLNQLMGQGIQAGIKGALNSTWLLNNHVTDASANEQTYVPSFGQGYGLSGAIFFSKKLGVEMNFFYDTHRQKYTDENETYESETTLNRISVPLMFKIRSETGAYFEIGAVYNALTAAKFSFAFDSIVLPEADIKDKVNNSSIDAFFGIGVDIKIVAGLFLTTALRFSYSMTDLKGVDAFGQDLSDKVWLEWAYDGTYEQTRSASAGFLVGLTYSIGKIAGED